MHQVNHVSFFTTFLHTAEEVQQSVLFTQLQIEYLYNTRTAAATEKVNMAPVPGEEVGIYQLRQEYLRGQMDILSYLIDTHEHALAELKTRNQSQEQG